MAGLGLVDQFETDFAVANDMGFIEGLRVSTVMFVRWASFLGPVSGPIIRTRIWTRGHGNQQ